MSVLIPGTRETLSVGGLVFTKLSSLIHLFINTTGTNRRASARKIGSGTSSGYSPSGVTFYAKAARCWSAGTAIGQLSLAQTDNDCGTAGTTAFTNPVYFGSESSTAVVHAPFSASASVSQDVVFGSARGANGGKVASTKYLSIDSGGAASSECSTYIFGYEL